MRARNPALLTVVVAGALALSAAELLVRVAAPLPPKVVPLDQNVPTIHEPDAELGWRNKEGRFVWPGRGPDAGRDIVYTFWSDGLRATAPTRTAGRPQVVVLGCSFTQGWAVTDAETYAWRLQAAFPDLEVLNYGTAGYGTYQSLLALERHFARSTAPPALVIYGMVEHHARRNVATADWLFAMRTASAAGPFQMPFVSMDANGSLVRHAPQGYPQWPFDGVLASVRFLEDRVVAEQARARTADAPRVLAALVAEMDRQARAHGTTLLVVDIETLGPEARKGYADALRGIATADCVEPDGSRLRFAVPGYGHPNGEINARWAACIGRRLREIGFH